MTVKEIIAELHCIAEPEKVLFKQRKYNIVTENALGVYMKDLNALAKRVGKNDALALELYDSGIYEGKILCSKIYPPATVTECLLHKWIMDFNNWEICDSFSLILVAKSPLARQSIIAWIKRSPEFEKRAGFATMAAYCMADKKADNSIYLSFLPIIKEAVTDERLYVKKAVNWALRSIGKRNQYLRKGAIECAKEILRIDSKAAQWIAKDALKELESDQLKVLDYPRAAYRVG